MVGGVDCSAVVGGDDCVALVGGDDCIAVLGGDDCIDLDVEDDLDVEGLQFSGTTCGRWANYPKN